MGSFYGIGLFRFMRLVVNRLKLRRRPRRDLGSVIRRHTPRPAAAERGGSASVDLDWIEVGWQVFAYANGV